MIIQRTTETAALRVMRQGRQHLLQHLAVLMSDPLVKWHLPDVTGTGLPEVTEIGLAVVTGAGPGVVWGTGRESD